MGVCWSVEVFEHLVVSGAFATITGKYKFKTVFPLIGKDFFKMIIGLSLSVVIVLLIHGFAFDGLKNQ